MDPPVSTQADSLFSACNRQTLMPV